MKNRILRIKKGFRPENALALIIDWCKLVAVIMFKSKDVVEDSVWSEESLWTESLRTKVGEG